MFGKSNNNLFNFIVIINRFTNPLSESVTDSKYVLNVLAVLLFSKTILSFSINANLEPPCESFEKPFLPDNCNTYNMNDNNNYTNER